MARYLVPDTKHSLPNTLCWLLSLHASPHPRLIQPQPIAFDVCFPVEKVFLDRTSESESLVQLDGRRHHVCRVQVQGRDSQVAGAPDDLLDQPFGDSITVLIK